MPGIDAAHLVRAERPAATAVLVGLSAMAPLAVDMFLPSMPAMAREFSVSTGLLSLAVTLFIIAFAASQLAWGPISDRFGRRPALLAGLVLFVAGSLLSLVAPSVPVLLAGRILQGLGGGAGPAVANAIVIDVYRRERAIGVLALITLSLALAPMVAPVFGGLIQEYATWRLVFAIQAGIGLALAGALFLLIPETNRAPDAAALDFRRMAANYRRLAASRAFTTAAVLMGLLFAGQLTFISTSSFVIVDDLGASPTVFGVSFGFVAFGIMLGATLTRRLSRRWPPGRIVFTAVLGGWLAALAMAALAGFGAASVPAVVVPAFLVLAGNGMARPAATATALADFPAFAGLASAVLGFSQMTIASAYSIAFGALFEPGPRSLAAAMALASSLALGLFALTRPPAFALRGHPPGRPAGAAAPTGTPAPPSPPPH
ncbi:multidrug effflux MFS transporter [Tepidiforma sp.]|uniref:multidrug effflux MFS transporter n=1 Tax=Tepidiforma sp. TaxID=2682230 RepID=UPI002ADD3B3E|nr:multidrug effflux MFS transporter [Tepidiforma sp.]